MFEILALDLHNTIYDEVVEYGLAMDAALNALPVPREILYKELSEAHAKIGSDWDDDVWTMLPSLKNIDASNAIKLRAAKSEELVKSGVYKGAVETLRELSSRGVPIYIVTEAAADIGMQAIEWLGLAGIVRGVYTYPSLKEPKKLANTFHKPFAKTADGHLKKPDPALLRDIAGEAGLKKMLYVGDSKYKDGTMAKAAGVKFAWAAYGKKETPETAKAKEVLYGVTGWDKETLKLTQEEARSEEIKNLQPDYILENSLAEVLPLF